MSESQKIIERGQKVLIGNYARQPLCMARGQGSYLWDADGTRYIDLFSGFGGSILGHCNPDLIAAVDRAAHTLWHVGNTFYTEPQIEVAERLNRLAFPGQAFFCQSGLEANEAACKLARIRQKDTTPRRWKIISLHHSFHGRSLAMIAATGNPKTRQGFEPVVPGFLQVEPGDIHAMEAAIDAETAGIIVEPIQGEGGVNMYPPGYLRQVRELCDKHGITLIFDEVWSGCGRTGRWFAFQHMGVEPDVFTMAKAIGGGLPVGIMYAKPEIARHFVPGTHGSTLGANGLCMAAAKTVIDVIERDRLTDHAAAMGKLAVDRLSHEPAIASKIAAIRGLGLMLGIELTAPPTDLVMKGLANGVLINLTAQKVIRLAPALNIPQDIWSTGLDAVVKTIAAL